MYINLLVLVLSIYNSQISIGILNIILNCLQLLLVFKISYKLFNKHTAIVSVIIYIFYLSTLGLILMNYTELFFGVLILASIYYFYKDNPLSYFVAGIFVAASIGVRPIGWALALSYLIVLTIRLIKYKEGSMKIFLVITGSILFIAAFGFFTQSYFNRFIYTNTNGPVNILIGANENATGAFNGKVFEKGNAGYIANPGSITYMEKEAYWKKEALNWIETHPLKWISLFPLKIVHMFVWDDYSIATLFHLDNWDLYRLLKTILIEKNLHLNMNRPVYFSISYFIVQIIHHLYYFTIISIFILIIIRKKFFSIFINKYLPVTLFILLGVTMNLATFGGARFKYPYMLFIIIAVSPAVSNYIRNSKLFPDTFK